MERMRDVVRMGLREGLKSFSPLDKIVMAWLAACGPILAGRGAVVGYDEGVVSVEVSEKAWLDEMRNMSSHLEMELGRIAGIKVTKLHFIVKR
ncbi:DciA family protein [Edaphobacter albus]|uniref:DciA family protein n=1 Tax=Edaphobacter sp. 4G125 TaxID=2763071 RepID=UPI0016446557|nr:DciA family protein [Edaphobacter sp. 4G125]QNI37168.1 DUF721 domain-containing protein [Edaphobacter sp. 4G125]